MSISFHQKYEIASLARARVATSRMEVSRETGIALPTVSTLVRDLIRRGVLMESGFNESLGGRKPARLTLDPDYALALGVELSTRRAAAMLVDLGGNVRARAAAAMPDAYDRRVALDLLFGVLEQVLAQASGVRLRGIGVGISGIVDAAGRVSREMPLAEGWTDVPVAQLVEERFHHPTALLNLVHAATLGEVRFGGRRDVKDMVYLHVGRGISVGIIANGRLYAGATGNAGEFGHSVVRDDAALCYCGNRGCLESLASPKAIVQQCRDGLRQGVRSSLGRIDPEKLALADVLAAAETGDRLAANAIEAAGAHIGGALANLINVLNPAVLMLGGLLVEGADALTRSITRAFRARVLPLLHDATRIETSRLHEDACALGAAAAVFDRLFSSPEDLLGAPARRPRASVTQKKESDA